MYKLEEDAQKKDFEEICKKWKIDNDNDKLWAKIEGLKFTSPQKNDVFNAFKIGKNKNIIKPEDVRVLIIGQDPYPSKGKNEGRAHGFAFSFGNGNKPADSLKNIFIAIKARKDGCTFDKVDVDEVVGNVKKGLEPWNTNLENWAKNNKILLLNTALTYGEDKNGKQQKTKHQATWKEFIKTIIINLLATGKKELAVFLWGQDAQNLFFECINSFGINMCDYNSLNRIIVGDDCKTNKIQRKILCLITGHPTPTYDNVHKYGFSKDTPRHFKACDEFLFGKKEEDKKNYIWLNFPENNKPKE